MAFLPLPVLLLDTERGPNQQTSQSAQFNTAQFKRSAVTRAVGSELLLSQPFKDRCHLGYLPFLGIEDVPAERNDFLIGQLCLLAHQDRAGVMRDHRSKKLRIPDGRLGPHGRETGDEDDRSSHDNRDVGNA